MTRQVLVFLFTVFYIGLSVQACSECECCKNGHLSCDSNKICISGCKAGYYGEKCTEKCLENCRNCANGNECTECGPGYYTNKCKLLCGKGCVNNSCSLSSGECSCKSANFVTGRCDVCLGNKYGDECKKTCPSNCGSCITETECSWCQHTVYYGSFCQYRCSVGCVNGRCNKGNGYCTGGCKSNFVGDKCDMCSPGLYGPFCDLNCKENCSACFSETNCTTCKSGLFGETCTNTCPIGCKGNCYFADGRCFECKPGFFGDFCNIACNDEKYGVDCSKLCRDKDVNCQMCIVNQLGDYGCCTKNVSAMITDREGFSVGTLIGSIIGSFLAGGIVAVTTLFSFITLRRRLGKNEETENNLVPDITHEDGSPVAYEDFNSRVEISYSQISTNQQISPPEAVYVNTRF